MATKLSEVLTYRRSRMIELAMEGYSDADIARYFEVPPSIVERTLRGEKDIPKNRQNNPDRVADELFKYRDSLSEFQLEKEGFWLFSVWNQEFTDTAHRPINHRVWYIVLGEQYDNEYLSEIKNIQKGVYYQVRHCGSEKKFREFFGCDTMPAVYELLKKNYGIASPRKFVMEVIGDCQVCQEALVYELYASGFRVVDIEEYMPQCKKVWIQQCIKDVKVAKVRRHSDEENVIALVKDGHKFYEIEELLGTSWYSVKKFFDYEIQKNADGGSTQLDLIRSYRNVQRREDVYKLRVEDGFTEDEVAMKLNITRATVNSDLERYLQEHPEAEYQHVMKGERRRVSKKGNENEQFTLEKQQQAVALRKTGESIEKISRTLNIYIDEVKRFLHTDEDYLLWEEDIKEQLYELKMSGELDKMSLLQVAEHFCVAKKNTRFIASLLRDAKKIYQFE